jgi:hypothetical protein
MELDRIVVGATHIDASEAVARLYRKLSAPVLMCSRRSCMRGLTVLGGRSVPDRHPLCDMGSTYLSFGRSVRTRVVRAPVEARTAIAL